MIEALKWWRCWEWSRTYSSHESRFEGNREKNPLYRLLYLWRSLSLRLFPLLLISFSLCLSLFFIQSCISACLVGALRLLVWLYLTPCLSLTEVSLVSGNKKNNAVHIDTHSHTYTLTYQVVRENIKDNRDTAIPIGMYLLSYRFLMAHQIYTGTLIYTYTCTWFQFLK